jgi:glycosyltransferase involved in cell wall biosynthesis
LPTLAESYGLVYLEALACGVPILTSDRDFARWMCQNLAQYFDPLDASSIVDAIKNCPNLKERNDYSSRAVERLLDFPKDWDEVARSFVGILEQSKKPGPHPLEKGQS